MSASENEPSDPLNYTESEERAKEYMRLTLGTLSQHALAPNPVNYTLCYDYVSGRNKELNNALDSIFSGNSTLSVDQAASIYRLFVWDDDKKDLEEKRAELRRIMSETITGVEESAGQASKSSKVLTTCSSQIELASDLEEIRGVVTEVVSETKTMARNGMLLKELLEETRQEVENLRGELERSRREATTDALTGLLNRRAFDDVLARTTEEASTSGESLCLLIVDIDHFKRVNDTYGHLIGDKVLRFIATQLTRNVKGRDTVARIGGEEFAVILPNTELRHAKNLAESIRVAIEKSRLKRANSDEFLDTITISAGTTAYVRGETPDEFVHRADEALYRSKNSGRNTVTMLV